MMQKKPEAQLHFKTSRSLVKEQVFIFYLLVFIRVQEQVLTLMFNYLLLALQCCRAPQVFWSFLHQRPSKISYYYSIQRLKLVPARVVENNHALFYCVGYTYVREVQLAHSCTWYSSMRNNNFALVAVHCTLLYVTLILRYFGWYTWVRELHLVAVHSTLLCVILILHYFWC